jgi:hypothetical protein
MIGKPVLPERVSASVHVTAKHHGQVSWLKALNSLKSKFEASSQWRDRTGFSPVSLFSPFPWGTQTLSNKKNSAN